MSPTSIAELVAEGAPTEPAARPEGDPGAAAGGRSALGRAAGARGAGPGRAVPGGGWAGRGDAPGPGGSGAEQQQEERRRLQTFPPSFSLSDFKGQPKAPGLRARRSRRSGSPQPAPAALIAAKGEVEKQGGEKAGGIHTSRPGMPPPRLTPRLPRRRLRGRQPVSCGEAGGAQAGGAARMRPRRPPGTCSSEVPPGIAPREMLHGTGTCCLQPSQPRRHRARWPKPSASCPWKCRESWLGTGCRVFNCTFC